MGSLLYHQQPSPQDIESHSSPLPPALPTFFQEFLDVVGPLNYLSLDRGETVKVQVRVGKGEHGSRSRSGGRKDFAAVRHEKADRYDPELRPSWLMTAILS